LSLLDRAGPTHRSIEARGATTMSEPGERIEFDILLKGPESDVDAPVTVDTVAGRRPSVETIERCRRWLEGRGVTCHPSAFGLACSAPKQLFESLFDVDLATTGAAPGTPPYRMSRPARPPDPIAELVDQITISAPPELF
jgi:hypothetical protein